MNNYPRSKGKFKVLRKYPHGWSILILKTKYFQFRWFTELNDWFVYIHLGTKRFFRFSSAGFLHGKSR